MKLPLEWKYYKVIMWFAKIINYCKNWVSTLSQKQPRKLLRSFLRHCSNSSVPVGDVFRILQRGIPDIWETSLFAAKALAAAWRHPVLRTFILYPLLRDHHTRYKQHFAYTSSVRHYPRRRFSLIFVCLSLCLFARYLENRHSWDHRT